MATRLEKTNEGSGFRVQGSGLKSICVPGTLNPEPRTLSVHGMTLIEILVVLAIFSILMALSAAGYWRAKKQSEQEGAVAQLDVLLRQVRNSAVSTNAP